MQGGAPNPLSDYLYYSYRAPRQRNSGKGLPYKRGALFYYKLKRPYKGNKGILKVIKAKGPNLLTSCADY